MKKKVTKNVTVLALSAGLTFSSFAPASFTHIVHAKQSSGIEQVLTNLTPQQRQAIKQLQTNNQGGLQLSPEVDQKSGDSISVIVQFKDKPEKTAVLEAELDGKSLSRTKAKEKVNAAHETFQKDLKAIFKKELKQKKAPYKIKRAYKHAFNGVAMTIPANKAKALLDSKAVKAVWSDMEVHVDPPVTEKEPKSKKQAETHTNVTFPGITKLHHEGFTGKGVKVGIIDTGIDYNHPDLKAAYKGGYDFVDNDNDPMETTYDEWVKAGKPWSARPYYTEHGTHVAGIIAGQGENNSDFAVTGVAPDAEIYAYRVLGPTGTGNTGAILAGIDRAVEDGMDVINMSLGADYNDPLFVTSIAVNNAVLAGVTAVVSAGNSGNAMYTLGSPGTSPLALTVGASDTAVTIPTFKGQLHADAPVSADLKMVAKGFDDKIEELKGQNLPVVDVGSGYFDKDVNGKIALAARGYIDLNTMIKNAKKGGAKALLLYNAIPLEDVYLGEGFDSIPVFSLSTEQGNAMKQALTSGESTFSFDEMGQVVSGGDVLADFSSRGPSRVLYDIKPEVTAPGVSVLSTVPSYVHGEDQIGKYQYAYERLSGTSMAAPNVAGVAALLKQANPDMTPADIKTRLMNTADPLNGEYSVYEVGAGRVDPYKAIHSQTDIQINDETETSDGGAATLADEGIQTIKETTGALSFGAHVEKGKHIRETRKVTLFNNSKETKTYDVKVEFQTLEERFPNDYSHVANDAAANGVTVETVKTVKVKAGKKKKTNVMMLVPKTAKLGNYEGYVVYTNKNNPDETYRVPFGIHTAEAGIDYIKVDPPAFTTAVEAGHNGIRWSVGLDFKLKSHMRTMDLFLVDPKTNKEIGFLGSMDGTGADENIEYYQRGVLNEGYYYPLTGDPDQPIAYDNEQTEPGLYKIRMVGTNDNGKTFTADAPVYYSATQPTLNLNVDTGVYEYSSDQKTVTLTGSVYDPGVEDMKAGGMDVSQANNKFFYEFGRYPTEVSLDANGNFSTELTLPDVPVLPVKMYAENKATVQNYSSFKYVYYVKQGTQYGTAIPDKKNIKTGDTVTVTLAMNNMTNMKNAEYSFVNPLNADIISIKPHVTLDGKVDIQTKNTDVTIEGQKRTKTNITATLTGDAAQTGQSGKVPMVDVTFKVKEDSDIADVSLTQFNGAYANTDDTMKSVTGISIPFHVERTFSRLKSNVFPEAFKNPWVPTEPLKMFDYVKAGAIVKVSDEEGREYPTDFGSREVNSNFFTSQLPITDKPFTLEIEVPGHFTVKRTFTVGLKENGELKPYAKAIFPEPAPAGDVNQDNVIDVKDALYIQSHWNTDKREADINFDGVVDEKDMQYVINNYLMQNPWMDQSPDPVKTYNGQTLESVLKALNIQ